MLAFRNFTVPKVLKFSMLLYYLVFASKMFDVYFLMVPLTLAAY